MKTQGIVSIAVSCVSRIKSSCLIMAICLIMNGGCTKEHAHSIITKQTETGNFNSVIVNGVCDLYLVPDTTCYALMKGPENWVNGSGTELSDSTLTINTSHKGEFLHPDRQNITVFLHYRDLKVVDIRNACHLRSASPLTGGEIGLISRTKMMEADLDLACTTFYFWNYPNGSHLHLTGNVQQLKLWSSGLSSVDARSVSSPYVLIENAAQGDIRVSPGQTLDYSITNTGNIYYYGNPSTIQTQTISGTGRLIKAD